MKTFSHASLQKMLEAKNRKIVDLTKALKAAEKVANERNKYRAALADLHSTIQRRMSADEPTPEDRLAIWSAWKAAGQILEENASGHATGPGTPTNNQLPPVA